MASIADPSPPAHDLCTCFHIALAHRGQTGRCRSLDSYGQPCACPSFERDTNDDDRPADPDDDWDEADPDGEQDH